MSISPIGTGDGRPQLHSFTTDTALFPLTGLQNSNLAFHLEDINNNFSLYICTGTYAITDGPNGKATFTPSAADLLPANPFGKGGVYKAYPVVTLASGPVPMDSQTLQIDYKP